MADAAAQVACESHKTDGVVQRIQLQNLPLNGGSLLRLPFLEPVVGAGTQSMAQCNAQLGVSVLSGSSSMAAITADGGEEMDL